ARRWAEGDEGRNAVRRERQRLELLQARERRRLLAVTPPSMVADAGGLAPGAAAGAAAAATTGHAGASRSGHAEALEAPGPTTDAAAAASAAVACQTTPGSSCRERAQLLKRRIDDAVSGFVSSFAVLPGFPPSVVAARTQQGNGDVVGGGGGGVGDTSMPSGLDPGCLWMGIDTGGGLAAAVLPRASLKELLDVALGGGNGGRSLRPAARGPEEPGTGGNAETTGTPSDDIARAFLDRTVAVAAALDHDDETCRREGGGRGPMRAAGSADLTVGDGAPAARLTAAAQLPAGQQPKRPAPPVAPPSPPPVTDFDDAIALADGGVRSRGGEIVASKEAVLPGVSSTKAGPSGHQGERQRQPPHAAVVSSDGEAAIIDALASALCRMAHPSRRQGLGCSGSGGGGHSVRRNVSPAATIEGDVTAPPVVAAGLAESPRTGAAAIDVKPSADCSTVAGPTTVDGAGINLGSRGFSDVEAADAGGITSAAPSVAAGDGGGGGGGCRRGAGGGDATGAILDDLA
ncbi:unnamed protein product, partial [Ectocarpus sp. 13 AM-2016]